MSTLLQVLLTCSAMAVYSVALATFDWHPPAPQDPCWHPEPAPAEPAAPSTPA